MLAVVNAGDEQLPTSEAEIAEAIRLCGVNGSRMDELLAKYFGLTDRYIGSFPYADRATGRPRVAWAVGMVSPFKRDVIAACFRAAILEAGLTDIIIVKSDRDPDSMLTYVSQMEIVAMGPSIADTLVGERRIQAALDLLEAWLSRE